MSFNMVFSFITLVLILLAVILKGQALEKLFYFFIVDLLLVILVNRGVSIALLFTGTIIPLFTRNSIILLISGHKQPSLKGIKQNLVSYIAFAPLIGLGIMSYQFPLVEIKYLSSVMIVFGEVSLVVITFLVIVPKRIKLK